MSSLLCYALLAALLFAAVNAQSGDSLAAALVPRQPYFSLNFSIAPTGTTAWTWASVDNSESTTAQGLHQGLAVLNQSISGAYIDLTTAIGVNSAGAVLGPIGGQGFYTVGEAQAGWTLEYVVKFSSTQFSSPPLTLLADALGNSLGVGFGVQQDYDQNDPDVGNRLELVQSNNASLVPLTGTHGLVEFVSPVAGQWYHIAICMASGSNSLASGLATWYIYVNGLPRALANAMSPNATLTALQGANLPQHVPRPTQQLGGWAELDAFRVYDYVLDPATVASLAGAYGLLATPPAPQTSFTFPVSTESAAMLLVVPTPPILDLDFSVNPAGLVPGIDTTTYLWEALDASDPAALQNLHQGLVQFNGSNYIDLSTTTGPTSCGVLLPLFGLPGSGSGDAQGLSIEIVFKLPLSSGNGGGDKLFDFGQGGSETVDLAYQTGPLQLQLEQQNQVAPGTDAGYVSNWIGNGNGVSFSTGVWYHFVWTWSNVSLTAYTANWNAYVNGNLSTNSPFTNAVFPPPVVRPIALLAGAAYNNGNLAYTLDTFRIFDYALSPAQVQQLAALKGLGPLYTPPSQSSSSGAVPPSASSSSAAAPSAASSSAAAASSVSSSAAPAVASSSTAAVQPASSSSSLPPAVFVTSSSTAALQPASSTSLPPVLSVTSSSTAPPAAGFVTSSSLSAPQTVSGAVVTAQASPLSLLVCSALPVLLLLVAHL
jgi:hypothetical protein